MPSDDLSWIAQLNVSELREQLAGFGLAVAGHKHELADRLRTFLSSSAPSSSSSTTPLPRAHSAETPPHGVTGKPESEPKIDPETSDAAQRDALGHGWGQHDFGSSSRLTPRRARCPDASVFHDFASHVRRSRCRSSFDCWWVRYTLAPNVATMALSTRKCSCGVEWSRDVCFVCM